MRPFSWIAAAAGRGVQAAWTGHDERDGKGRDALPGRLMSATFGRTLYNLTQRASQEPLPRPARPDGALVWLHVPSARAAAPVLELARRLAAEGAGTVLVTCPEALEPPPAVLVQPPPPETAVEARAFLDHWRPAVALFSEGELRPAVMDQATRRGVPLVMLNARLPHLPRGRDNWFPGLIRGALAPFSQVLAVDEAAARAFRRAGARAEALRVSGRLEERPAGLPCLEAEREALARQMAARPVWVAAALPRGEERAVLAAQRNVMAFAHRLLLILVPADPSRADTLARRLEAEGWNVARRSSEEEPREETEVYLASDPAELGLWYRLAPVTFLGGSLLGDGAIRNPLEAAALGSAIVHGPRPGVWGAAFDRLGAARAARAVASPEDLGNELADLLSPERVARLAQAAWTVASEGAELTDAIVAQIRELVAAPA